MCGIVGVFGIRGASAIARRGLERLEYRGYDSAGLAWLEPTGIEVLKQVGRVRDLPPHEAGNETVALAHTRWATHGGVRDENAHPHLDGTGRYAVVHNGTIEGHHLLRGALEREGHSFRSETDTEVLAHLYEKNRRKRSPLDALRATLAGIEGSWAIGLIDADANALLFARHRTPLILGLKGDAALIASDVTGILQETRTVVYLDDGDHGIIDKDGIRLFDAAGRTKPLVPQMVDWDVRQAEKSGYAHFMLKEIHEAPTAINQCLAGRIRHDPTRFDTGISAGMLSAARRIRLVACGTSYHAALLGRHFLESWARIPTDAVVASELRDRPLLDEPGILYIAVSQSGETLDTMEAIRHVSRQGYPVLAITNVQGSSLQRLADETILTRVGPEVGVAATKTFLGQVTTLALLALQWAQDRRTLDNATLQRHAHDLSRLPRALEDGLTHGGALEALGRRLATSRDLFFLGRGVNKATALEAALKFKEITYLHAEGFGAAELKHGPFALLSHETPCVFFVPDDPDERTKVIGNMVEVAARGAPVLAVANGRPADLEGIADLAVTVGGHGIQGPLVLSLAGQVIAYHAAQSLGRSIDMPRNLAKSVTVE